ncbi:MAG: hypothetical protein WAN65_29880, partial [Candidatus Sulfotelmatobacter sp.]
FEDSPNLPIALSVFETTTALAYRNFDFFFKGVGSLRQMGQYRSYLPIGLPHVLQCAIMDSKARSLV